MSIRSPTVTSNARAQGFNKEAVDKFFDLLEEEFVKDILMAARADNDTITSLPPHSKMQPLHRTFMGAHNLKQALADRKKFSPLVIDSNPVVLREHILPVLTPKNERSNRGRKSSVATLLTASSYKHQIEESIKSIAQRGRSRRRARGRSAGQNIAKS
ncbi:hypothetical protein WA026_010176 [Henosepilachna vigintioctopunctata]|uniref:Uncharacterized protein n=1 Tax=Henosepilachna vigintioctopunctata TaxID=420089 RepID=A0AAW1UHZ5_9CUCU